MKAGVLPGEIILNATRFHGNALDPRERTRAAVELRNQAYFIYDFFKQFVGGFRNSVLYDIAPTLGVRETRRITGDYVLTQHDVRSQARFDDAIGLSNCPIDINPTATSWSWKASVTAMASRTAAAAQRRGELACRRAMHFGGPDRVSLMRNTPACALTAQAAGIAAAQAAARGISPRELAVSEVQRVLSAKGVVLGTQPQDRIGTVKWARPLHALGSACSTSTEG